MNLNTGERIIRGNVTPLPLTNIVKEKVESMAREEGITHIKFTNKKRVILPCAD